MEPIILELGQRIRRYRLQRGLTQEALAEKAELHNTYIGQVERGEKNLTINSLGKILSALDITFAELFENIEDTRGSNTLPAQCYQLISSKGPRQQSHLYRILLEIDQLLQS